MWNAIDNLKESCPLRDKHKYILEANGLGI